VRGEVAAGRWLETPAFLDAGEITDFLEGLAIPASQAAYTYGLRVRGTSLNKLAMDGDVLVVLDAMSGIEFAHRDVVIVERIRDQGALREVTAKRLLRRDGRWILKPESTDPMWQNEIEVGEDVPQDDAETRFIAKVKHIIKPLG
jgi:SOS-response transcriptional repressor LexA